MSSSDISNYARNVQRVSKTSAKRSLVKTKSALPVRNSKSEKSSGSIKRKVTRFQSLNDFETAFLNSMSEEEMLCTIVEEEARICAKSRSCSGTSLGPPNAQNIKIVNFGIRFFGVDILKPTILELLWKHRYALIGPVGCGKSTLLTVLANREINIPMHVDIYHLSREAVPACAKSVLQCVIDVDYIRNWLMLQNQKLAMRGDQLSKQRLLDIYDRLDDIAVSRAKIKATNILRGLGFLTSMQNKPAKDFSRSWRMRIALARALFIKPHLLLLDDPTHYLDLEACAWLEQELKSYKRILVIVTNSEEIMSNVCTNFLYLNSKVLKDYNCSYKTFTEEIEYEKCQKTKKIAHEKQSLDLQKNIVEGLCFKLPTCGGILTPLLSVVNVSFRYDEGSSWIFKHLNVSIEINSRIALVGNCGKSTMLQLLSCEIYPSFGVIYRNVTLRVARYYPNLHEMLDLDISAFEYLVRHYDNATDKNKVRIHFEQFGLKIDEQMCPMRILSDCQRNRVLFAFLTWQKPHLLLLDEPTTFMDTSTINSLADALLQFDGAVVLVTNDHRLISKVATEIWVCENERAMQWDGDVYDYRQYVMSKIENDFKRTQNMYFPTETETSYTNHSLHPSQEKN